MRELVLDPDTLAQSGAPARSREVLAKAMLQLLIVRDVHGTP